MASLRQPLSRQLMPGHFMAFHDIPLSAPFISAAIPAGDTFDIHDIAGDQLLIKYEGMRVWKDRSHFMGHVTCLLPNQVVHDDGYHIVPAGHPALTLNSGDCHP